MRKVSRTYAENGELYDRQAAICKAFANSTRIHLLDLLCKGETGAAMLQKRLGISKANLSQHLSVLRAAGIVSTRREGKRLVCLLSSPEVKDACAKIRTLLRAQLRGAQRLAV